MMLVMLPLVMEAGMLYWWWCVYFLIFNLLIELSSPHLLSFSLSSKSYGEESCYVAGKHRPYSYIRVYFLILNLLLLTLYLVWPTWQVMIMVVLPLAMEVGMLYWWWCVSFSSLTLAYWISCSHLLSFSLSSNSNGELSCIIAGEHRLYSYIRVYFLTSTNSLSWFNYLTGYYGGHVTINEGSWYVVQLMKYEHKSSFSSLMHSLLSHNSNAYKACAGKGYTINEGESTNLSLILMIAKIYF